jgi:hypothetical protein
MQCSETAACSLLSPDPDDVILRSVDRILVLGCRQLLDESLDKEAALPSLPAGI